MLKRQLELNVGLPPESGKAPRRTALQSKKQFRRQGRSDCWFARMRQVVDDAHTGPRHVV